MAVVIKMFFDTHAHYDSGAFNADRDELLASMPSRGVGNIIDPGCDEASSRAAVALAEKYGFVYAAVGWQPEEWESWTDAGIDVVRSLAGHEKVVAIGEIGLDYYWDKEHTDIQKRMFSAQLSLARELDLPVIVHDREAHGDCLDMVRAVPEVGGVFHCFSGSAEMALQLTGMGWYLGFDGPITYKNNVKAAEVLAVCPPERILLETDSPYLTPVPYRGKRNDSSLLPYIAARVAELTGMTAESVERITHENACRLFGIK